MANFITIGSRIVNLDQVCGAERRDQGKIALYFAPPNGEQIMHWIFDDRDGAGTLWHKLSAARPDLAGGMDIQPLHPAVVDPLPEDMLPIQTD
jgi:hypothetical protein